jgi:hypothetical protein
LRAIAAKRGLATSEPVADEPLRSADRDLDPADEVGVGGVEGRQVGGVEVPHPTGDGQHALAFAMEDLLEVRLEIRGQGWVCPLDEDSRAD